MHFDRTGKVSLDHIYDRPDPVEFFRVLRELDYCVPQSAKPYFAKLLTEHREAHPGSVPQVLDLGCGYGVNAAILQFDTTMDELYDRYTAPDTPTGRPRLLSRDRDFTRARQPAEQTRFVGLDTAGGALAYAVEAGFLHDAVHADLESHDPTPQQRAALAGADLVISTGCLGYVTERTLARVVRAQGEHRPPMAHFVLRMFPFAPVEQALDELGYRTTRLPGVFRQRRFASPREQEQMLDTMTAAGVSPDGLETEGWLYAELFLSRAA
ncbi:hypothetical protein [Streptomyces sulphureus]|uniref:hypothetical protein n=1 Tax=Streptomyces sulphureus TaxID=47758 RepID=UPI0003780795|nr:hypothetical protein [Streptomyces sulphureus]